jgi:hypothetical protein
MHRLALRKTKLESTQSNDYDWTSIELLYLRTSHQVRQLTRLGSLSSAEVKHLVNHVQWYRLVHCTKYSGPC